MTRAQLTVRILGILGPHHRRLNLAHPRFWTAKPVTAARAAKSLRFAQDVRRQLQGRGKATA